MRKILLQILRKFQGISVPCLIKQISTNMVLSTRSGYVIVLSKNIVLAPVMVLLKKKSESYQVSVTQIQPIQMFSFGFSATLKNRFCLHKSKRVNKREKLLQNVFEKGLNRPYSLDAESRNLLWLLNTDHNTERWFCVEQFNMLDILPKLLCSSTSYILNVTKGEFLLFQAIILL